MSAGDWDGCICGRTISGGGRCPVHSEQHGTSVWEAIEKAAGRKSYQPEMRSQTEEERAASKRMKKRLFKEPHLDILAKDEYIERLETSLEETKQKLSDAIQEIDRMNDKLMEGTLHTLICNGNHDEKVGRAGMICNCPPGQEINRLRYQLADARKEIKKLEMPTYRNHPEKFTVTFIKHTMDVTTVLMIGYGMDEKEAFDLALELYESDDEPIDDYMGRVKDFLGDRPLAERWHRRE